MRHLVCDRFRRCSLVALQACEGRICLSQAMPSIRTDPGPGQGRAQRAGFAGRRSLTGGWDRCLREPYALGRGIGFRRKGP
jgi:hypothetical protein